MLFHGGLLVLLWIWWIGVYQLTITRSPCLSNVRKILYVIENTPQYLEKNIELGIHAIEIISPKRSAYFKESVPISKNYDLEKTFKRLCKKAKSKTNCPSGPEITVKKYDTITYWGNRTQKIQDLYRYNILVDAEDLDNHRILESITWAKEWFLNNRNKETGLLEYRYRPSRNKYSKKNNHVRQLGALWALTELRSYLHTDEFDELITKTLNHYLQFKIDRQNPTGETYSFLSINGKAKLAFNAFIIYALTNYADYPEKELLLNHFARGILHQQNADGSYRTYFESDKNTGTDFYPGEAMLALTKLYKQTRDNKYINSVKKAFPYYRDYWRNKKNTAFIPWHTSADLMLYQETNNPEIIDFIFEMNDWLIDTHQIQEHQFADLTGAFTKKAPRYSTSSYMESINDAYSLAKQIGDKPHQKKYADSIRKGTRFILQTQFTPDNVFYLKAPEKAIGGFKESLVNNRQRIDFTQHAVIALIKALENDLFK